MQLLRDFVASRDLFDPDDRFDKVPAADFKGLWREVYGSDLPTRSQSQNHAQVTAPKNLTTGDLAVRLHTLDTIVEASCSVARRRARTILITYVSHQIQIVYLRGANHHKSIRLSRYSDLAGLGPLLTRLSLLVVRNEGLAAAQRPQNKVLRGINDEYLCLIFQVQQCTIVFGSFWVREAVSRPSPTGLRLLTLHSRQLQTNQDWSIPIGHPDREHARLSSSRQGDRRTFARRCAILDQLAGLLGPDAGKQVADDVKSIRDDAASGGDPFSKYWIPMCNKIEVRRTAVAGPYRA